MGLSGLGPRGPIIPFILPSGTLFPLTPDSTPGFSTIWRPTCQIFAISFDFNRFRPTPRGRPSSSKLRSTIQLSLFGCLQQRFSNSPISYSSLRSFPFTFGFFANCGTLFTDLNSHTAHFRSIGAACVSTSTNQQRSTRML